jgi:hypothetical protein
VTITLCARRLYFASDTSRRYAGPFRLVITAAGERIGDDTTFEAAGGSVFSLPASWQRDIDERGRREITLEARLLDASAGTVGTLEQRWREPYEATELALGSRFFSLVVGLQLPGGANLRRGAPSSLYVCRAAEGDSGCTRGLAPRTQIHLEIDPVEPQVERELEGRPELTRSVSAQRNPAVDPSQYTRTSFPLVNPPVIPLSDGSQSVRVEYTKLWATGPYDPHHLHWRVVPLAGGAVGFVGDDFGARVRVYGTREGEVRLEVVYRGATVGAYRALVRRPRRLPFRFNILRSGALAPVCDAGFLSQVMRNASEILRQVAVELVGDSDTSALHSGAAAVSGHPGFFHVEVPATSVAAVPEASYAELATINARPRVANFTFARSASSVTHAGAAYVRPRHPNFVSEIVENEWPETSWARGLPTGSPREVRMRLQNGEHGSDQCGLALFEGAYAAGDSYTLSDMRVTLERALSTLIVHELGHAFGLHHRGTDEDFSVHDGVEHPRHENIMTYGGMRYDIDVIQAKAIWQSAMIDWAS